MPNWPFLRKIQSVRGRLLAARIPKPETLVAPEAGQIESTYTKGAG